MAGCVGSPPAAVSSLTPLANRFSCAAHPSDNTARKLAEEAAHNLSGRLIHAQEEEQTRLARELHDDLSQSLALLSVELEMFGQNPPAERRRSAGGWRIFSTQVKGLSSEVHRLSHELHPAKLDQLGLVAAVRGFCKEFALAHEMAIEFSDRSVPRTVPEDAALCLYRIAQEALHNVVNTAVGRRQESNWRGTTASFASPSPMTARLRPGAIAPMARSGWSAWANGRASCMGGFPSSRMRAKAHESKCACPSPRPTIC